MVNYETGNITKLVPSKLIILAAGKPFRGNIPSAMNVMPDKRSVIEWVIDAFSSIDINVHLVLGYKAEDLINHCSKNKISYSINVKWENTGAITSLEYASLDGNADNYVCYSDVVFNEKVVSIVHAAKEDVVIAVDPNWLHRYDSRSTNDYDLAEKVILSDKGELIKLDKSTKVKDAFAEFAGLVKFSPKATKMIVNDLLPNNHGKEIERDILWLINSLINENVSIKAVDVAGNWAELNAPQDLANFILGTKAETIYRLQPLVGKSHIGKQISFTCEEWKLDKHILLKKIQRIFADRKIAVRSSALSEDCWNSANAGVHLTLLNVNVSNYAEVICAVDKVIDSYLQYKNEDQILVQEMVENIKVSGVVFTRSLSYGAPYYTINYDDTSKMSDSVTSGKNGDLKTVIIHKNKINIKYLSISFMENLISAVQEIEELVCHDSLDIEFIIDNADTVHILQIRPIAVNHEKWHGNDQIISNMLYDAEDLFIKKQTAAPFIVGENTIFGLMPDWNPAEIIGTKPKCLARSIYEYIVTDGVWARQRAEFGYRDVRPMPLMYYFAGQPYIDTRASFNSFVPAALDEKLANKLVNYYLMKLSKNPQLHDKIEFEIAITCLDFNIDNKIIELKQHGFSEKETIDLKNSLKSITNKCIKSIDTHISKIKLLDNRYEKIINSKIAPLEIAVMLLEDCIEYGTLPFAHLARNAFIAVSMLKSMVSNNILSNLEFDDYLNSITTVASQFKQDSNLLIKRKINVDDFMRKYGHLRPGTYEITEQCYEENLDNLMCVANTSIKTNDEFSNKNFKWKLSEQKLLDELGLQIGLQELDDYIRKSIEGRESAKFVFTRNVSKALEMIKVFGSTHALSTKDLSHVHLQDLMRIAKGEYGFDIKSTLKTRSKNNEELYEMQKTIELPPLICKVEDLRCFLYPQQQPNYVSNAAISAEVICLQVGSNTIPNLTSKIVLIAQADPGFDWIFSHDIAGLITAYGGANSHMAIRVAEFNIPAAIGVGENLYKKLMSSKKISLDCVLRKISIVI